MQGIEREIVLPCYLHGREANYVVRQVNTLKSKFLAIKNGRSFKMNSLLELLSLGGVCGETIKVVCMNDDKKYAEKDFVKVERILEEARGM